MRRKVRSSTFHSCHEAAVGEYGPVLAMRVVALVEPNRSTLTENDR